MVDKFEEGAFQITHRTPSNLYQDNSHSENEENMAAPEINPPGAMPHQFMHQGPPGPVSMGGFHGPPQMPMGGPMMGPMGPPPNITQREFRGRQHLDMLTANPDMINMMSDQDLEDVLKELDKETGSSPFGNIWSWMPACCAFFLVCVAILGPATYYFMRERL